MATVSRKSIWGRYLGLDRNNRVYAKEGLVAPTLRLHATEGSEALVDIQGWTTLQSITSASTTVLTDRGVTSISSAALTLTMGAPPATGVIKKIVTTSTSTLTRTVTRSSTALYFESTDGSTMVQLSFKSQGSIELVAVSTSLWHVLNRMSTDTSLTGTS